MSDIRLLSTDELRDSVVGDVMEIRMREYDMLQKIAELDRRGAATELGYKDLPAVLRHAVRWDPKTARQWVEHAKLLAAGITPTGSEIAPVLPATANAASQGALSIEHVAAVAEVMKKLPATAKAKARAETYVEVGVEAEAETLVDVEALVVDFAREHEPAQVKAFGKDLVYIFDQDGPEPRDSEPAVGNQHVMRWQGDKLVIRAILDKVTGAKYEALLDPLAKPRPETPEEGPDRRSRTVREGDALAELINLMLRADQLPEHGGEPVTLTVTMNYDDLAKQVGMATLDNQDRLPASEVRELACLAGIIPLILGSRSQPLDVGRKSRLCPIGMRRVLVIRDKGCAFPGCSRPPKHCDAHHIKHWADGGDTSVENSVLLCRHHHRLIHHSEWAVRMVHGLPTFYPPEWLDPHQNPRRNLLHT